MSDRIFLTIAKNILDFLVIIVYFLIIKITKYS